MKADKKKFRNDIILIIFLCVVAGLACFFMYFNDDSNETMQLQIVIDGEIIDTYNFSSDKSFNKEIILDIGNTVVIKNGQIYIKEANCPDELCIKQGKISNAGESIICLPHKLIVRIVDISEDAYVQNDGLDVMPR